MANEIEGLDEVIARMRELGEPRKVKNAATRSARKAMNIVRKAAIENAKGLDDKDSSNRIWKNIITKPNKTKGYGYLMMRVGVKGGARKYPNTAPNRRKGVVGQTYETGGSSKNAGGDTWYWRFLEYGSATNSATPFLRPALNNNKDAAESEFKRSFSEELDKEIAKL
ncbi:HK97-gp10 family putative phage morphogenesis protein [Psychrobacter alimentarius]|uniref:HK97-gp10 family putative phage morphogenesis protein n=1 Tax=Psychrobacter alimentarius TaxID=261164 RepID=UPI003FCF4F1B